MHSTCRNVFLIFKTRVGHSWTNKQLFWRALEELGHIRPNRKINMFHIWHLKIKEGFFLLRMELILLHSTCRNVFLIFKTRVGHSWTNKQLFWRALEELGHIRPNRKINMFHIWHLKIKEGLFLLRMELNFFYYEAFKLGVAYSFLLEKGGGPLYILF